MRTKILLLTGIVICLAASLKAQINKGRYLIGGSFSMYKEKEIRFSTDSKSRYFTTNIQVGKVVKDNVVAGIILSYNTSRTVYADTQTNKGDQYGAGIFYKQYKKLAKDLYFFGELDAGYFYAKSTQLYLQNGHDVSIIISNGGSLSFIPGISYALCKRLQAELLMPNIISLSYSHVKANYTGFNPPSASSEKGNTFYFNTNLNSNLLSSFGLGFKFLLGK